MADVKEWDWVINRHQPTAPVAGAGVLTAAGLAAAHRVEVGAVEPDAELVDLGRVDRRQVEVAAARGDGECCEPVAQGREPAGDGHLRGDGEDQPRDQRAHVAGGGEHQQPPRAAARQHHARAHHRGR